VGAVTEALDAAWQDLHDWRRLAEEQRRAHPDPNHASHMPSQAGIDKTRWILDALMPPAFLALETLSGLPVVPAGRSEVPERTGTLDLRAFSRINRERCESPTGFNHALSSWSLSDWFTAVLGELGEAANVAKKLNRVRDGIPGNRESADDLRAKLARELADTFIYIDLLAQSAGIDLSVTVPEVFNAKSEQIGSPIRSVAHLAHREPPSPTSTWQPKPPNLFYVAVVREFAAEKRRIGDSYLETRPDVAADYHLGATALDAAASALEEKP
jgi:NTP pyrophosphatase (non-canonical NTP hydrolase)